MDDITDMMDVSLGELWELVLDRAFTGWGRKPLVPSTCAGDLRKV